MKWVKFGTLAGMLLGMMLVVASGCGSAAQPRPTQAPIPPAVAPQPSLPEAQRPSAEGLPLGQRLFVQKGCATCHGQNAEGTAVAPAIGGHSEAAVKRQTRNPVGRMPIFSLSQVSDDELERIAQWVAGLAATSPHVEPSEMPDLLAMHHWMAIAALKDHNVPEAAHHVQHILELAKDRDHQQRMDDVLERLKAGDLHDAEHMVEEMLAGKAEPNLTPQGLHLRMAMAALGNLDVADAQHHLRHFLEMSEDKEQSKAREVIRLIQEGHLHEASHHLEDTMEQPEKSR